MIILLKYFHKLGNKSSKYSLVWCYIFSRLELDQEISISIFDIISKLKINQKTLYPILNFGFDYFNQSNFDYCFDLKNNTIFIIKRENFIIKEKPIRKIRRVASISKKGSIKNQPITTNNKEIIERIINYLNTQSNKDFSVNNNKSIELINSRLSEGFEEKDFILIIDLKVKQWLNTFNDQFLRPITLFGIKMESYINEKEISSKINEKSSTQISYEQINEAKSILHSKRN